MEEGSTAAVRNYAFLSYFVQSLLLDQSCHRVECAAYFERPDALEVFTFEEQMNFRVRGLLVFPLRFLQCFGCLGRRRKVRQRGVGQHGGIVNVGFD